MEQQEKELWKKNKWILYGTLIVIVLSIFLNKCNNSEPASGGKTTTVKITTPEVKGDFQPQKPIHTELTRSIPSKQHGSSEEVKNSGSTEPSPEVQNLIAENQRLVQEFNKLSDSLKIEKYKKAVQLNAFNKSFEDENVKIDITGIVQGEVKSVKPTYIIKPKTINVDVPIKEKVFSLRAGGEYGNTLELNKSVFKGNLEFENKKGNTFNYGYDTDRRHWIGYKHTIFSIKK